MEKQWLPEEIQVFLDSLSLTNLTTSGEIFQSDNTCSQCLIISLEDFFSIENMISLNRSVRRRSPASRSAHTLIICKAADFIPSDVRKPAQLRRVPKEKKEYMQKMKRKSSQNLRG